MIYAVITYVLLCLFMFFYPLWKYRHRESSEYEGSDRYMWCPHD